MSEPLFFLTSVFKKQYRFGKGHTLIDPHNRTHGMRKPCELASPSEAEKGMPDGEGMPDGVQATILPPARHSLVATE